MINVPCSIRVLLEDIWKLSWNLNIYNHHHVFREANRNVDCLVKQGIGIIDLRIWVLKGKLFVKEDVLPVGTKYARLNYGPSIKYEQFKSNNNEKKKYM